LSQPFIPDKRNGVRHISPRGIAGKRGVTADTALRLACCFGNSPEFWLNRQAAHDLRAAEREGAAKIEREVSRREPA